MEQHKSNIQELLECLSLISEDDFRDMSQAFKSESLMLSGSAMAFGNVFLLMEIIKELKELKNILKESDKPREQVTIDTSISPMSVVETMKISLDKTSEDISKFEEAVVKSSEVFKELKKEEVKEKITPPKKKSAGRPPTKKTTKG